MKNKLKKIFSLAGWILFAITLFVMFWVIKPSKTVDFSGIVKSIEYNQQEKCSYITASMLLNENTSVVIKVKDNVSVKEVTGEKMNITEIKIGDLIDLDYKGTIDGKNSIITAKWIKVAKDYSISNVGGADGYSYIKVEENNISNELFNITTEPYESENIKIVTEKKVYSLKDKIIKYSITNVDGEEHSIAADDDCFSLHMLFDGEWKRVGTKNDHNWNSLAQILNPNQTEEREINLDEYFNLPLDKGTYRVAVENLVSNTFEIS